MTCTFRGILRCSQNGFLNFDGGPGRRDAPHVHPPFATGVGDSQDEVSKVKKKSAARMAIASAVIAPAIALGTGTATAVPH
ncbi:hypothetical protein RHA1_ro00719 [Rhodococcus jostii RHA1]|uniref:Uncharacterized protein n=1 Tax=Rhodococcus jostii (strain RHA1) TaxID=101510 RepID=Q0SIT2_RHOJR|nr:hypothetical protein RHA1_ro00719 [Rhodococcus jostii RHA1]